MKNKIDALDEIVKHKDIARRLRDNGADGHKIYKMLCDVHGLKSKVPIYISESDKKKRKEADYARRKIKTLINYNVITDKEKESLCKMDARLETAYPVFTKDKGKAFIMVQYGNLGEVGPACDVGKYPSVKLETQSEDKAAISEKQFWGRQVVEILGYIRPFINKYRHDKPYSKNDQLDFIAELFDVIFGLKFSRAQIKYFEKNNW